MTGGGPRAILFDFDGTLCDTDRAARRSWEELFATHGEPFPDDVWAAMAGRRDGHRTAAAELGTRLGRAPSAAELDRRTRRKAELADHEPLRPGVRDLLVEARGRGTGMGVVSNSSAAWVGRHLGRLGIRRFFDVVITGEQVAAPKPAPEGYLRAVHRLGSVPGRVSAVEDSAVGIAAAKAAGLRCVAVPGSHPTGGYGAADAVVDLADTRALLASLL